MDLILNREIPTSVFESVGIKINNSDKYKRIVKELDDEIIQRDENLKDFTDRPYFYSYGKISKIIQDKIDKDERFYQVYRSYASSKGVDRETFMKHETGFDRLCYYLSACELFSVKPEI